MSYRFCCFKAYNKPCSLSSNVLDDFPRAIEFQHHICDINTNFPLFLHPRELALGKFNNLPMSVSGNQKRQHRREDWECIFLKLNYIKKVIRQTFLTEIPPLLKPHPHRKFNNKSVPWPLVSGPWMAGGVGDLAVTPAVALAYVDWSPCWPLCEPLLSANPGYIL